MRIEIIYGVFVFFQHFIEFFLIGYSSVFNTFDVSAFSSLETNLRLGINEYNVGIEVVVGVDILLVEIIGKFLVIEVSCVYKPHYSQFRNKNGINFLLHAVYFNEVDFEEADLKIAVSISGAWVLHSTDCVWVNYFHEIPTRMLFLQVIHCDCLSRRLGTGNRYKVCHLIELYYVLFGIVKNMG